MLLLALSGSDYSQPASEEGRETNFGVMDDVYNKVGKRNEIECCMCGDVGFQEYLFRCLRCHQRFQHIYCSRLYTCAQENGKICEWCLDSEAKCKGKVPMQSHSQKRKLEMGSYVRGGKEHEAHVMKHPNAKSNVEFKRDTEEQSTRGFSVQTKALGRRYKLLSDVLY